MQSNSIEVELTPQELESAEYAVCECILYSAGNDREDFERLKRDIDSLLIKIKGINRQNNICEPYNSNY